MVSNHSDDSRLENALKLAWADVKPDRKYNNPFEAPAVQISNQNTKDLRNRIRICKGISPDKKRDH